MFALAFGESLAVVSLIVPATALLAATGGLLGAAGLPFWPGWVAATLGAAAGDAVSYWIGRHFRHGVARMWPFVRRPKALLRGIAFFRRWGVAGVFLGRFLGPLRATVPLAAGICNMPALPFQLANIASAAVWGVAVLAPGTLLARLLGG